MTELGKPLVFYLKYMAEMERLSDDSADEDGELDLVGLDDAERVRAMALTVGAAASEQAAEFLEMCAARIQDHFTGLGIATLAKPRTRSYMIRNWEWGTRINVSSVSGSWFVCGVTISGPSTVRTPVEKDVCGIVAPWLWSQGGRSTADAIRKSLGRWPLSRTDTGDDWDSGTVPLACIPITAQPLKSFDVDHDQLLAEVTKLIKRIGARETKVIAKLVAARKQFEEG